ncbi:hypothetical protein FBU30_001484 [Linnemannia zychae]|nr:hypothetical protein FBU30_001484 [Linnemannia zychae]
MYLKSTWTIVFMVHIVLEAVKFPDQLSNLVAMHTRSIQINKRHVDVLGSGFRALRGIYSNDSRDKPHELMVKGPAKFGSPSTLELYLDGQQPEEKEQTIHARNATRKKAAIWCSENLDMLEQRIQSNVRVRKEMLYGCEVGPGFRFLLLIDLLNGACGLLREAGYNARLCHTEADVAIATDLEDNVVISCDSTMFAYANITKLFPADSF